MKELPIVDISGEIFVNRNAPKRKLCH